jgi:hypothetical protein
MILLVYCHIKSFQRVSSVEKPWPRGEKKRDGQAAHPVAWGGDWVVSSPMCATRLSPIAIGCLISATPRSQPWTSAVTFPHGCNELSAQRMGVLYTCRAPSLCCEGHRELMRSAVLDVTSIIPATTCHQRNYVERDSRCNRRGGKCKILFHSLLSGTVVVNCCLQ